MAQSYNDFNIKKVTQCFCSASTYFPKNNFISEDLNQQIYNVRPIKHNNLYAYISVIKIDAGKLSIILKSPYEVEFYLKITVPLMVISEVKKVYDENIKMISPIAKLPFLANYDVDGLLASWSMHRQLNEEKQKTRLLITSTGLRFEDLSHPFLDDKRYYLLSENQNLTPKEMNMINEWKNFVAFVEIPWWVLIEEFNIEKYINGDL